MKPTTKILVIALCFVATSNVVWGQNPPAFRSIKSGNWNTLDTWQQQNPMVPGGWGTPDHIPSSADGVITIQLATHVIEITSLAGVTADELVINGILRVRGSTLEIANGSTQQDLSVSSTGVLELGQGAEGGVLKSQKDASCEIKQAGKLRVVNGSINSSGPMLVSGTLELINGFLENFGDIKVLPVGLFRMVEGGINNLGDVLIEGVFEYSGGMLEGNPFRYQGAGHRLDVSGSPSTQGTITTTQTNKKLHSANGLTSLDVFWPTTEGPANVNVTGTFTLNFPRTISGSLQCAAGRALHLGATLTSNGTTNISGTIQINEGGSVAGNKLVYSGSNSALVLNVPAGSALDSANAFWPSINGPSRVHVQGAGGLTLNAPRTVNEFYTYVAVHGGNHLTVSKQLVLWSGGSIIGAPTYLSGSTLNYQTGGTCARGDEWSATSGAGYPVHVTIGNNTTLNYPNGSTAARAISGDLSIAEGSALRMDFGNVGVNNPLTIGGNVHSDGTLSLGDAPGGDLYVGGNWTKFNNRGAFSPNSRVVVFNGSTEQLIGGINSTHTFDHVKIANLAGVRLDNPATINQSLTFSTGNFILPYVLTLSGPVHGASKASHAVTLHFGYVAHVLSPGESFQFPVGGSATSYNPITISRTGLGGSQIFYVQVKDSFTVQPKLPNSVLRRQWGISTGNISNMTLTFQWEANDPAGSQFNPATGVAMGWHNGAQWVETTATYTAGPPRQATASFTGIGGVFGIGSLGALTNVAEQAEAPTEFALYQNHPNPFNPATIIRYAIPRASYVTLKVYDPVGHEIETLVSDKQSAGKHEIRWNPVGLPSGIYFFRLQAGDASSNTAQKFVATKKLVFVK